MSDEADTKALASAPKAAKRGRPSKRESAAPGRNDDVTVIRKYPNRRLYDTSTSSYIKLDDVVTLIEDGRDFVIEDARSGEDITRSILNQIIYERETGTNDAFHFPLDFQKQLIAMYGDATSKMVPDYLTQSLSLFAQERDRMGEAVTKAVGTAIDRNTRAMMDFSQALARQNMELFKRSWSLFTPPPATDASSSQSSADAQTDGADREAELRRMQAQIDALQRRLADMS